MQFPQPGKEASGYGRRGAAKSTAGAVYRMEGESLTMVEIADRLCITPSAAQNRMRKLRGATGAITWARLRA
jgi:GTP-sensing pleiotropic transcriptional regulator CodY